MITKTAEERLRILQFWWQFGTKATMAAYGAKRSTLYYWQQILREKGLDGLNPGSQARINQNKRQVDSRG